MAAIDQATEAGRGRLFFADERDIDEFVDVLGKYDFLEVWNHDRLVAKLSAEPFTDDDAKALSDFGI